ncbi:uncharacterized protein FOMMEDRAFT_160146 [Fomitiporia mediterranea MF3/22]|uniref:uncharacterized protein n=1 Tax=Fomitiporia mediterranea (strain MF3/22) TaxID=694068 RepID=UPI0004408CD1|nr:uncharacterized protein FOMMEDRAFT_160146 [Fomitiporia mediterranea MF3/22]EJC99714.1 hypothetical protein FOMMEDRAFT_160146 [Fomitiporia mediterranea MF3/22]
MGAMVNLRVIRLDYLRWDVPLHRKQPNLYAEISLGGTLQKTRTIKDKLPTWNEILSLNLPQQRSPLIDESVIVSIRVLHKSAIPIRDDVCIGSVNTELHELSGRCINGPSVTIALLC